MKINLEQLPNNVKIVVRDQHNTELCRYVFQHKKAFNKIGRDLIKTTLISWATLDFCKSDYIEINIDLFDFEKEYIISNYEFCVQTYCKIYDFQPAKLVFNNKITKKQFDIQKQENSYFLGYTCGKDSTLSKFLLEHENEKINYYKVSYDDDNPAEDGHIFCEIKNEKYFEFTITGLKEQSDIVSCQQADDIHVTLVV